MLPLRLLVPPNSEPVTLAELKMHLHLDFDVYLEDDLLLSLISSSREAIEKLTNRALITQTWAYFLDVFPAENFFKLPLGNLQTVENITYVDSYGDIILMEPGVDYGMNSDIDPGLVTLPINACWPRNISNRPRSIRVEYTCGYGDFSQVPSVLKSAIKLVAGDLYENRESQIVSASPYRENKSLMNLIGPYRMWDFY